MNVCSQINISIFKENFSSLLELFWIEVEAHECSISRVKEGVGVICLDGNEYFKYL